MNNSIDISQNKPLLWLMALACGLCAGANYYCQPLIASIQQSFQIPQSEVALTVTIAQVSYALGLLFIVPLGDILNKTKFIPLLMFGAAAGLALCAMSTEIHLLWLGTLMAGLFSVAAQVLIPLATMASKPEKTGEVVGLLMSGLLVGILLSTSIAGLLSELFHWKMIYVISAVLMVIIALALKIYLPSVPTANMSYWSIMASMLDLLKTEPRLVYRAYIGAFAFAAMSILFSTIAILLSSQFHLTDLMIGFVSLAGVIGALSTRKIGQFADRGHIKLISWLGLSLMAISWLLLYLGQYMLLSYILGVALINLGLATIHSSNQNVIFRLRPDAKSRVNAIYMTFYFVGGASGSALGIYAWQHGGWKMACLVGISLVSCAAIACLVDQISHRPSKQAKDSF